MIFISGWIGNVFAQLPKLTKEQGEWGDCEIGAIIHFDIHVYEPEYDW
ncbi:hypothetical protein [Sunxiuqinia sp. sy24]